MKFHGCDIVGVLKIQEVTGLDSWTVNDERRLVYDKGVNRLYFGSSSGWMDLTALSSQSGGVMNLDGGDPESLYDSGLIIDGGPIV